MSPEEARRANELQAQGARAERREIVEWLRARGFKNLADEIATLPAWKGEPR